MILTPKDPTAMATKLPSLDTAASSVVILNSTLQDSENVSPCQIPCFTVPLEVTSVRVLFSANSKLPESPDRLIEHLQKYFEAQVKLGFHPWSITKNWSYLFKNYPGSKMWRSSLASGLCPTEAYKKANLALSFTC